MLIGFDTVGHAVNGARVGASTLTGVAVDDDPLLAEEEASGERAAVPGLRQRHDLCQPPHVVVEGRRANVTQS